MRGFLLQLRHMQKQTTTLPDVFLIQPDLFPDERGTFFESYNRQTFKNLGINDDFIQDSVSISKKGVLRGLHFQKPPYSQAKLVSVITGEVFDVAVDVRPNSQSYGKWFGTKLSGENHTMMYVPEGFAHGFYVLSTEVRFLYKISGSFYNKEASTGIIWNDPTLNISWPLDGQPLLSQQDQALPHLK